MDQGGPSKGPPFFVRVENMRVAHHREPIRAAARPRATGVTIPELLAALGMLGIVCAIGASAHTTYTARAQITDAIGSVAMVRGFVEAAFAHNGEPPARLPQSVAMQARAASPIVETVDVTDGRIDIVFGSAAPRPIVGRRLSLTPYETADLAIVWICGNDVPGPGLEPLGFAGGGRRAVQLAATVEARFLPPSCR